MIYNITTELQSTDPGYSPTDGELETTAYQGLNVGDVAVQRVELTVHNVQVGQQRVHIFSYCLAGFRVALRGILAVFWEKVIKRKSSSKFLL